MKRALLVVAGTVAGLGATLTYVPQTIAASPVLPAAEDSSTAAQPASAASPAPEPEVGTTGPVAESPFGPVQVAIVTVGDQLKAITPLQTPTMDPKSITIAQTAIPALIQEALTAQSADIAVVAGASYTSAAFTESLAGALATALGASAAAPVQQAAAPAEAGIVQLDGGPR